MLNKEIPLEKLKKIKMLILDSDGVTVERGTKIIEKEDENYLEVSVRANKISDRLANKIKRLKDKMIICLASGRGLIWLQSMYSKIIDDKTVILAENGNIALINGELKQLFNYNAEYFTLRARLRNEISKLSINGFEPKQIILTANCPYKIEQIPAIIKKLDKKKQIKAMWVAGEAWDIQRKDVSKGAGIKKIMRLLKLKKENLLAVGDGPNDKEMVEMAGIGISTNINDLKAQYYTVGKGLGGEILVDYLLEKMF